MGVIAWACIGLVVCACAFAAWAARDILVPVSIAGVIAIMLSPVAELLERTGLPPLPSALVIVLSGVAAIAGLVFLSLPDISRLAGHLPQTVAAIEGKAAQLREALAPINAVGERVQEVAQLGPAASANGEAPWPVVMRNTSGGWVSALMSQASGVAVQVGFSIVLIVFMLGERRRIRAFAMRAAPDNAARRRLRAMMLDIRNRVSRFLLAQTLSNLGLGVASGLALAAIGFPGPLIWGAAVFLGNFIPYAGGFVVQVACLIYGLAIFDTIEAALLPPLLLAALNFVEGQFVTPWFVGRHVVISPLAVLLAVGFGGWIWGAAGALVAVPGLIVAASALQHWWRPAATRPGVLRFRRRKLYAARRSARA